MRKILLFLAAVALSATVYAQQGDMSIGAKGSYLTVYKNILYGLEFAYHVSDPLEISFSQMINPNITKKEEYYDDEKLGLYATNLDLKYYLLYQRSWGGGPIVGGQYMYVKNKENSIYDINALGFSLGWHLRINLSDNLRVNGTWKYTTGKDEINHHAFGVGLTYTFNIF